MPFWHYTYTHLFARWLCAHEECVHIFVCSQLCKVTWSKQSCLKHWAQCYSTRTIWEVKRRMEREFLLLALTVEWIWGPLQGYGEGKVFKEAPFSSYFRIFLLGTEIYFENLKEYEPVFSWEITILGCTGAEFCKNTIQRWRLPCFSDYKILRMFFPSAQCKASVYFISSLCHPVLLANMKEFSWEVDPCACLHHAWERIRCDQRGVWMFKQSMHFHGLFCVGTVNVTKHPFNLWTAIVKKCLAIIQKDGEWHDGLLTLIRMIAFYSQYATLCLLGLWKGVLWGGKVGIS